MRAKRFFIIWVAIVATAVLSVRLYAEESISGEELMRRTKELFDGVITGDNASWQKYFAQDCMYFDERGRSFDKAALMKEIVKPPEGYELSFKFEKVQTRIFGNIAVHSYDIDEDLRIFGQKLGARFHTTDTWLRRDGTWQIIASQIFRYYGDPAPGQADPKEYPGYAGTYELASGVRATVSAEGENLFYQRGDNPKDQLIPEAPRIFFRKGVEGRMLFRYGSDGKVDALISRRNHEDVVWKKVQ